MQTVNISLPESLARKIDERVVNEGYSSRSEFVRALIRDSVLKEKKDRFELLPFKKIPLSKLKKKMQDTGRYNQRFINSVIKGLSESSVYGQNKNLP